MVRLWTHALFHDTRILFATDSSQTAGALMSIIQHFSRQAATARGSLASRINAAGTTVRLWLEHANDVVVILDLDGNLAYVNSRAEELSGRPRDHWLGRHFSDLVVSEDLPMAMRSLHRCLLGEREVLEVRVYGPEGREVQLSLSANPIYEEGVLTGLLCIGRDMTKWNETQNKIQRRTEQLSTLYGISTALTQSLDLDRILHECLLRILALLRIDAASIRLWDEKRDHPGEVRARVGLEIPDREPDFLEKHASTGEFILEGEDACPDGFVTTVITPSPDSPANGTPIWTTYHYLALRAKGKLLGVLTLVAQRRHRLLRDDQTLLQSVATQVAIAIENALLFEQLKNKTEEVAAKNRELEDFVRIASHDLRSPLVSVQGFVEACLDEFGREIPGRGKDFLKRAIKNTVQMQELITRLQELTQAGHVVHCEQKVDLNLLVREIASVLEPKSQRKKVSIKIGRLPTMKGDPIRLRQLFLNLMDNAVKYTTCEHPTHVDVGHRSGVFYIRDQGCGIPREQQEVVFRPMVRLVRDGEGTGMGLAIARRVVESFGGSIWLESSPGQGTTFFFRLQPQ